MRRPGHPGPAQSRVGRKATFFRSPSVPSDVPTYRDYRRRSIEFIEARNLRIKQLDL
jgi:hypothetical protein